jgi:gamma-glutamyltranspeptidase/glutathione hydrolase
MAKEAKEEQWLARARYAPRSASISWHSGYVVPSHATTLPDSLTRLQGNAADALVGAQLCVGVIGMYHSGIGGGGFMIVRDPDGNYESIDYRETAPAAADENMFFGNVNGSIWGGLSAGIPGELRGLGYVHNKYGALPWTAVVEPSVRVARDGFEVTADLVRYMAFAIQASPNASNFLVEDPVWAEDFAPNGTLDRNSFQYHC